MIGTSNTKSPTGLIEPPSIAIEAVAYVRMSTEHQQYSTQNEISAIGTYASAHGMWISQVYSDDGISGLRIENRSGLQNLIADVLKPDRRFARVPAVLHRIKDGTQTMAIDQQPYLQGFLATTMLAAHIDFGVDLPTDPVLTGPAIIDASNIESALAGVKKGAR